MANPQRGDVAITLKVNGADREFTMRPTFEAIAEVERATGRGLLAVARSAAAGELGLAEATAIVAAGLKAAGEPATREAVGPMVFETGLLNVLAPLVAFLQGAISGGRAPEPGEAKAAEATDTPSAA